MVRADQKSYSRRNATFISAEPMSIQNYLQESYLRGLIRPDNISVPLQALKRALYCDAEFCVYHPYVTYRTHPYLKERWHGASAPVRWSTFRRSRLLHIVGSEPEWSRKSNKPIILDPNDNAWVLLHGQKSRLDIFGKDNIRESYNYLASDRVRFIFLMSEQIISQFKHLFGNSLDSKIINTESISPRMRLASDPSAVSKKLIELRTGKRKIRVLCLASDFYIKCIPEVLQAWHVLKPSNAELTIVLPKLSTNERSRIFPHPTIKIIEKAPLTLYAKKQLLSSHDMSLCLTWIDGGTNIHEALEYQHGVITTVNHRLSAMQRLGIRLVDPAIYYYDIDRYSIDWTDQGEFIQNIYSDRCSHYREHLIGQIAESLSLFLSDYNIIEEASANAELMATRYSLSNSNSAIRRIYSSCLGTNS